MASFEFRVSDVLDVPLRGQLLRLRVTSGRARTEAVAVGKRLVLRSPSGNEREVRIKAHSITGGELNQTRLNKTGQLDVVVEPDDDDRTAEPIGIGWVARPTG
jgi:hypothetical protein